MNPPENNWGPQGHPQPVLPSGGTGYLPSPRPGMISVDALGEAWGLLRPNIWPWVLATLLPVLSLILGELLCGGLFYVLNPGVFVPRAGRPAPPNLTPATFVLLGLVALALFALNVILAVGTWHMANEHVRTGKAEIGHLFNPPNVYWNLLGAGVLCWFCCAIGMCFCYLPGIYVMVALYMTPFIIVDQKLGPVDAMRKSWDAIRPQWFPMLLVLLVSSIVSYLGCLACFVGLLVTIPLSHLTMAIVYRDLFLARPTDPPPGALTAAPIADPFN